MHELEKHIEELETKTQQTKYEFVQTELDACFSAVENSIRDLGAGSLEAAHKECDRAEKGYKAVVGFVAEVGEAGQQAEVEERWNALRARLDTLQTMLKNSPPE